MSWNELLDGEDVSNYWRLCEDLTLKQAALLIVGCDPDSKYAYCEEWKVHERPTGYGAAKQGLSAGLLRGAIKGKHCGLPETDMNGNEIGEYPGTTDPDRSTVERDSLVAWLKQRGITGGFFFPTVEHTGGPDYLDPNNSRYAPKLAAPVSAWLAVTDPKGKTPKQALDKWLREHAAEFGMVNDDGNPVEAAVSDCSKLANWEPGGGAPKTPGG